MTMSIDQYSYLKADKESPPRSYDSVEDFAQDKKARSSPKKAPHLKMNYDDILEELGELGSWQILHLILLWIPSAASGIFVLTYSFTGLEPSNGFRCALPCDSANATFADLGLNNSQLFAPDEDDSEKSDFCKPFAYIGNEGGCQADDFNASNPIDFKVDSCDRILYADFEFESTFVTDLDLICDKQFMVALVGSIYMVGLFFGSFLFGYLGDKIGRKLTLMVAILTSCGGSLGGSWCKNYIAYAATRFITALGAQGVFLMSFSLSVELVGNRRKTFIGNMIQVPFAIGESILGLVAMGIRDWSKLQIVVSAPLFAILLLYFVLPESPRWLIATGRYKEAAETIQKAAKMNKVKLSPHLLDYQSGNNKDGKEKEHQESGKEVIKVEPIGPLDLFTKSAYVRKVTLIMFFNWIVVTLGYYGISMSSTSLGGDIFVSFILTALIEIPSYIFCVLVMDSWGRKPIFVSSLMLTGIAAIAAAFLDDGLGKTILALIGKFGAAGAFSIVYLYTAELYPTVVRSTAVGLCSMMARIGGISAPQVAIYLPQVAPKFLPLVIMGGSAICGGFLSLLLPETLGALLPETMEEVGLLKDNDKGFFQCWSKATLRRRMQQLKERKAASSAAEIVGS